MSAIVCVVSGLACGLPQDWVRPTHATVSTVCLRDSLHLGTQLKEHNIQLLMQQLQFLAAVVYSSTELKCAQSLSKPYMASLSILSLYIQLNQVDGRVLVSKVLITAHSDLYIVSGRVRELPTEPGRGVELTAWV